MYDRVEDIKRNITRHDFTTEELLSLNERHTCHRHCLKLFVGLIAILLTESPFSDGVTSLVVFGFGDYDESLASLDDRKPLAGFV